MTVLAIIFFSLLFLALILNAPGIGVIAFILFAMQCIQEGSHGKLPLMDYFIEGGKLFFK